MNNKNNKKMLLMSKITITLSVFLLLFGSFVMLQNIQEGRLYYEKGALGSFLLGVTLLISAYMNIKRFKAESEGKTIADERSLWVGEKAGFVAFLLLIACLMVSGLANSIFNLRLEYTSTVYVISVAGAFSLLIIGLYIDKKGDV